MASSSNHSSQFYSSESKDGANWYAMQGIPNEGSVPSLTFFQGRFWLSWTGTDSNSTFCNCCLASDLSYDFPPIINPTQADLQAHSSPDFYLSISDSVWGGQRLGTGPMYFAVKEDKAKGTIIIHYIFLYAYQPGQTVRVLKAVVPEFDALLWDVGYHQADLEHFAVTLKPLQTSPQTFEIQNFIFEADDNQVSFPPDQVNFVGDTHAGKYTFPFSTNHRDYHSCFLPAPLCRIQPSNLYQSTDKVEIVASVALAGRGIWNRASFSRNFQIQSTDSAYLAPLEFGAFFDEDTSADQVRHPWEMPDSNWKQLGLDTTGKPINDQLWSTFQGRLGISQDTSLRGASYLDGSDLSGHDWALCKSIFAIGDFINKIPAGMLWADGPKGPGSRDWDQNAIPVD